MTGYRESEMVTICNDVNPNIVVPFVIYECSGYYDKNRPSWEDMKRLAVNFNQAPLKPVGFKSGPGFASPAELTGAAQGDEDDES